MATNANDKNDKDEPDKPAPVTEEDLRKDKYDRSAVDTPDKGEDESDDDDKSDDDEADGAEDDDSSDAAGADGEDSEDDSDEDSDDDEDTFVKEFDNIKGDTLPEYTRNLEKAYHESGTEALRLKTENDQLKAKDTAVGDDGKVADKKSPVETDPTKLFMKQKMDEEIQTAYTEFSKDYTQVDDPAEYNKFVKTVKQLSTTILGSEGRMATPRELYSKAAVILDWKPEDKKPTGKEKVGIALKARAGQSTKGGSGNPPKKSKSKVTQSMVELNRKMYPGKTDAEIRTELEPYVQ